MAFESKSIFKLVKAYQSSGVGLSFHNCRLREKQSGGLKPGEIEDAEIQVIKNVQQEAFLDEYTALHRQTVRLTKEQQIAWTKTKT